ncbi:MAG: hypothetical protein WA102_03220 [Candidatus Methanoperedens sp.]
MSRKVEELKIKSVGQKIKYRKAEKAISSMCAVRAEDANGVEHKAFAWGDLCDKLTVGSAVAATKEFSPNKRDNRFIILKSLE